MDEQPHQADAGVHVQMDSKAQLQPGLKEHLVRLGEAFAAVILFLAVVAVLLWSAVRLTPVIGPFAGAIGSAADAAAGHFRN